jgi:hypothetical protein
MNITFIKEFQSELTGNSQYMPGDQATFDTGQTLIDIGVARAGWNEVKPDAEPEPDEPDYYNMTVSELIAIAKQHNISYVGLRKSELIEALEELR